MRERIWSRRRRFHVGLRTIKTAAAIIVSMVIVDQYGSSASKLIFAMLGAMSVVQPTFKASVEAWLCLLYISPSPQYRTSWRMTFSA